MAAETYVDLMLRIGLGRAAAANMPDVMRNWDVQQLRAYIQAADDHHMVLRTLTTVRDSFVNAGRQPLAAVAQAKINAERERISISLECFRTGPPRTRRHRLFSRPVQNDGSLAGFRQRPRPFRIRRRRPNSEAVQA
jgi:hypothetical protein